MPERTTPSGARAGAGNRPTASAPDARHDPGNAGALERVRQLPPERQHATPIVGPTGAPLLIGTASWTDPTITVGDVFYPRGVSSAEDRLRYYASRFPIVEVDSTYYALPARRMAELWLERTPDEFTFNVKAFALMTGQPSEVQRLPKELRDALPSDLRQKTRVYAKDLPAELYDAVWATFLDALEPLRSSGKLGAVLLQYPRWFLPSRENREIILDATRRLGDIPGAVELRNHLWFGSDRDRTDRTLGFLAEHDIPYVMVDGPQGLDSSVPPIAAVTSPRLAMVRLHGRRADLWEAKNARTVDRYRYLYDLSELEPWIAPVVDAAKQAKQTHVMFNNCYGIYGTTNALEFTSMLLKDQGLGSRDQAPRAKSM